MNRQQSVLFAPYKSLGVFCCEVRPVFRQDPFANKTSSSLVCSIDNVVIRYNAQKLRIISISDNFPEKVSHVMCNKQAFFAVSGSRIGVMPFCRDITRWIDIGAKPKHCLLFGDQFVIVDEYNGIRVINVDDGHQTLHMEGSEHFDITALMHPPTYLNKILVGSSTGRFHIYNIRTGKLVHEFEREFDAAITVIEPSPALDVMAFGLVNGRVVLHNVKIDQTVCSFKHDHAISAIGFRNDGEPLMTSADVNGFLAVWNLEKKELLGKVVGKHSAKVTGLFFFPGEPVMLSTSADNSIRKWILDQADGLPRSVTCLDGHSEEVQTIQFCDSHKIISAGLDGSVRMYSVIIDTMRATLGYADKVKRKDAINRYLDLDSIKIQPVCEIAIGWSRENAWDNVLCRHTNTLVVTTWTSTQKAMNKTKLIHDRFVKNAALFHASATSITISPCGNFGIIGYSTGHVDQFNIQSGRFLRTFIDGKKSKEIKQDKKTGNKVIPDGLAHKAAVTGLSIDSRGKELITGCAEGQLKFWNLETGVLVARKYTKNEIAMLKPCRVNSLIAVVLKEKDDKNYIVSIIDIITRRVVRSFKHVNEVKAVEFSPDGRWLLVADSKCYIRVWEMATSSLIDVILCGSICVGISFNPTGEFLATCHQSEKAIYVWANKCQFMSRVQIRALPFDYEPTWNNGVLVIPEEMNIITKDNIEDNEQLDPSLVTYSGLAPSLWANLPDITIIKERNKPVEAPKKPKQAPFFLSAAMTLDGFEFEKMDMDEDDQKTKTLQAKRSLLEMESNFTLQLRKAVTPSDLMEAFAWLRQMSVSAADFQIRTLNPNVLAPFFKMLLTVLRTRRDFDLVQSYMAAIIKIHRSTLWKGDDDELNLVLEELSKEEDNMWNEFDNLITQNSAVVQWTKNALI